METPTTQMFKVDQFCTKYNIGDEGKEELINLFNDCMVHVATGILNMPGVSATTKKGKTAKVVRPKCKGKTKTGNDCKKYAVADGEYCKTHTPIETSQDIPKEEDSAECNAICKNGEPCKQSGRMMTPEGAKFKYCFKHSRKWKEFEGTEEVKRTDPESEIELTEFQEEERKANNLTKSEYLRASADYDIRQKKAESELESEEMEDWKKENQIEVNEPKEPKEPKPKKTKKPNNIIEKMKAKQLKAKQLQLEFKKQIESEYAE